MIQQLRTWLLGIIEDDPIPYEIKNICFVYSKYNGCFILSMGGTENKPYLNNLFDYYPLESQVFYCKSIMNIKDKDYYENLVKYMIDESFASFELKSNFMNRHIYFGEYGKNLEFLFVVKKF
jgi:hypothetical protein